MKRHGLILVVDDDVEILKMLSRVLDLEGFDVATAADGRSALEVMNDNTPDLLILDIVMPKLDGFRVLDRVRHHSNVPIIMLTGKCEVDSLRNALALGADDYVRKPFDTRVLVARVWAKLRRSRNKSMG